VRRWTLVLVVAVTGCRAPGAGRPPHPMPEDPQQLAIGRSPRRAELVVVRAGEILATADGARLEVPALIERLASADVVFVGESHAHRQHHEIEARLLGELARRQPGVWALGLEMYPRGKQPVLDRWSAGQLEERDFVREVDWYKVWGFDWRYYRELLVRARDERVPVRALNLHAALVRRVGRGGMQALTSAERAALPALDLSWIEHQRLFRALIGMPSGSASPRGPHGKDPHTSALATMYEAQVLWDTAMAESALAYLEGAGRGKRLLVVSGSGHMLYGLGINGRLAARAPSLRQQSVLCDSMPSELPAPEDRLSAGIADFIWGTAPQSKKVQYPSLGVRLAEPEIELKVGGVSPHGAGARLLKPGDRLLALDGEKLQDAFDLRWRLQQKQWGEQVRVRVSRGGQELELTLRFRP
jgi:uncharacterized iron-regulated protein